MKIKFLNFKYLTLYVFSLLILGIHIVEPVQSVEAQEIPELHMLVVSGDVFLEGNSIKTDSLDGYKLIAKIGDVSRIYCYRKCCNWKIFRTSSWS